MCDTYPTESGVKQLANQTKLTEKQLFRWFGRQRMKLKQEESEFRPPTFVFTIAIFVYVI